MRLFNGVLAAAVTVVMVAGGSIAAQAAPSEVPVVWHNKYTLVSVTKTADYVDHSQRLARCTSTKGSPNCKIDTTATSTQTLQVQFGMSYSAVAGQLNWSTASTETVTIGCTNSSKMAVGQQLIAYPVGVRSRYKIHHTKWNNYGSEKDPTIDETSGWQYGFNPNKNDVACEIAG